MKWRIRHRGEAEDNAKEEDRSYMNLECAGCEHPIADGQPFIVIVPGVDSNQGQKRQRASRRAGFSGYWAALLASVAAFSNGVENVSGVIPPFVRDFFQEHGDAIKLKGKDAAMAAAAGARGAAVFLKGIPHIGALALGTVLVVMVSTAAFHAYATSHNRRTASKSPESELLYFHASCFECGGDSSCFESFAAEVSEYDQ